MRCLRNVRRGKGDIDLICVDSSTLYIVEYKRINPKNKINYDTGTDPYKAKKALERQVISRAKLVIDNLESLLDIIEERFGERPIITSVEIYGIEFERRGNDMVIKIMYLGVTPGEKPERFYIEIAPYFVRNSYYNQWESLLHKLGIRAFINTIENVGYKGKTIIREVSLR